MTGKMRKRELLDYLTECLKAVGYSVLVPSENDVFLFYKLDGLFVLTLGIEFSRHYDERFTGSFFLSKSFEWAYILPNFPRNAYARIGRFLTTDERKLLLEDEFCRQGVIDAWWSSFTREKSDLFIKTVVLAEPRFFAQSDLKKKLSECEDLSNHIRILEKVIVSSHKLNSKPSGLQYQPASIIKAVPQSYYYAAEIVLSEIKPEMVCQSYVSLVARDAWRFEQYGPKF